MPCQFGIGWTTGIAAGWGVAFGLGFDWAMSFTSRRVCPDTLSHTRWYYPLLTIEQAILNQYHCIRYHTMKYSCFCDNITHHNAFFYNEAFKANLFPVQCPIQQPSPCSPILT